MKVDQLESQVQQILAALENAEPASLRISPKAGALQQNRPNPFKGVTTIEYELPSKVGNGQLVVMNLDGKQIKSFNVNDAKGSLEFDGSTLAPGTYIYTLIANGEQLAQQKMVVQ